MEHNNLHTINQINHNKEVHCFYLFIVLITIGILVLQPISMVFLVVMQSLMQ
jgi:hypothetical protein